MLGGDRKYWIVSGIQPVLHFHLHISKLDGLRIVLLWGRRRTPIQSVPIPNANQCNKYVSVFNNLRKRVLLLWHSLCAKLSGECFIRWSKWHMHCILRLDLLYRKQEQRAAILLLAAMLFVHQLQRGRFRVRIKLSNLRQIYEQQYSC